MPDSDAPPLSVRGAAAIAGLNGRIAPRHPYVNFSWFYRLDAGGGHLAHTTDVSERGAGFISAKEIARGERILLVLSTPKGRVNMIARVVHVAKVDANSYRAGVELEVIPPPDTAIWADLVKKDVR